MRLVSAGAGGLDAQPEELAGHFDRPAGDLRGAGPDRLLHRAVVAAGRGAQGQR